MDKTSNKLRLLYKTIWLFYIDTAKMLYHALMTTGIGHTIHIPDPQHLWQWIQVFQKVVGHQIVLTEPRTPVCEIHENLKRGTLATHMP